MSSSESESRRNQLPQVKCYEESRNQEITRSMLTGLQNIEYLIFSSDFYISERKSQTPSTNRGRERDERWEMLCSSTRDFLEDLKPI